jgi:hypothetical protein
MNSQDAKKDTIVIYHSADFDGIFSREIARRHFGESAEYIGWDHGDPVPAVSDDVDLYMIDISIRELMEHPRLVWIDHHKSEIDAFPETIRGYRIEGVAACRLAWQWFFGWDGGSRGQVLPGRVDFVERRVSEPWAVRLAGEYDVWDKRDGDADVFQFGLCSCEPDFARLLGFDSAAVARLLAAGHVLQSARNREDESIIKKQGFTVRFEGYTFLACNAARFNSLLFTAGLLPEHDGCLGFNYNGRQGRWKVSLYGVPGKPDIDFSPIAIKYGGGGHRQACGFECERLPFLLPLPLPGKAAAPPV